MTSLLAMPAIVFAQYDLSGLDGKIDDAEKRQSQTILKNKGSNLSFLQDGSFMKINVSSEPLYVASLCLATENKVYILHASAALGMMSYALEGGKWSAGQEFSWAMRDTAMSAEVVSQRSTYLDQNMWAATTMSMGTRGQIEFVVNLNLIESDTFFIAAGLMTESDPKQIVSLPQQAAQGCGALSLVAGRPENSYPFDPTSWYQINRDE